MNGFYDAEQRVYLRRDSTQYGRIGTSPTGAVYDLETRTQDVFWEHEGADIVSSECVDALMSEEEYCERQRAFFHAMRQPGTETLRRALWNMRHDRGQDWRAIPVVWAEIWDDPECWQLITDRYQLYSFDRENFYFEWLHQPNNAACPCEECREERKIA